MATITKTIAENQANPTAAKSTWTLSFTLSNITASGSTITIPAPTLQAKYSAYGNKNWGAIWVSRLEANVNLSNEPFGSYFLGSVEYSNNPGSLWAANTNRTIVNYNFWTIATDQLFNSLNPTVRTENINITLKDRIMLVSATGGQGGAPTGAYDGYSVNIPVGNVATITLDAPPTFDVSPLTIVSPSADAYYAGYSNASVEVSNLSAKYGGTISSIAFTIGTSTVTRSTAGVLTIPLNESGTFSPKITVTDSRGQTRTHTFDPIVVKEITRSVSIESLDRIYGIYRLTDDREIISGKSYYVMSNDGTRLHPHQFTAVTITPDDSRSPRVEGWYEDSGNDFGVLADEGQSALITAQITYVPEIADLEEPIIQVDNETDPDANPYITWYYDRALTNPMDWTDTSSLEDSEITIYGYIDNMFNINQSYKMLVIPVDNEGQGLGVEQMLATAFYTVDFKAGGHGIAFGLPANQDGFYCGMDAHFENNSEFNNNVVFNDSAEFNADINLYSAKSINPGYNEIWVGDITSACAIYDSNLTSSTQDKDWLVVALKVICQLFPNVNHTMFKGRLVPNATGIFEAYIYNTSAIDSNGIPQYSFTKWMKWTGDATGPVSFNIATQNYTVSRVCGDRLQSKTANQDVYFVTERTDTGTSMGIGIGAGGTNHGLWSYKAGKWIIYNNGTNSYIDEKDPFNSGNQSAGTLPTARLPVMLKRVYASSPAFIVEANSTWGVVIPISVPSGYELVGCIAAYTSHGQSGTIGHVSVYSSTQIKLEGKWTGSNRTEYVATVGALCALSNIF